MRIVDLHTHVLPGADDGAANREEAVEMLKNAAASQTEVLVATPHCNLPGMYDNYLTPELIGQFQALKEAAKEENLPLTVLLGMEVHVTRELPRLLRDKKVLALNGSRYLLMEFPFDAASEFYTQMLQKVLQEGYVPLIAHPERCLAVWKDPKTVIPWLDMGCHLQLTAGSILGRFGKEAKAASDYLLRHDLVACAASDAHGARMRTNFLGDLHTHLRLNYSQEYAQALLWNNPLRICRNEAL